MRKATQITLLAATVLAVAYDAIAYLVAGNPATISRVVYGLSSDYPIVAVVFGIIIGHLFWPQHPKEGE